MTPTLTELRLLAGGKWLRRGAPDYGAVDQGYDVTVGQSIQSVIDATPAGGTIRVGPGDYRITTALVPKATQRLIGPSVGGYATLRGDVVLTGWTKDGSAARWYTTSGSLPGAYTDSGQCEINSGTQANPCQKREQVWLDDVHLDRVMTVDTVTPSSFYQDYATGRTYIGVDPAGRRVEMDKVAAAINSSASGVLFQGFEVKRFASASQSAAVVVQGTDWEIGYNKFTENHAIGLHLIRADRAHVHHNNFFRNGQLGMGHYLTKDSLIEANNFEENNTDGYWRADWEAGGFKGTFSTTVVRNNTSHNNEGVGIWFDIDNINCDVYGNVITDNYADGLRFEISFDSEIHDNTISGNGYRYATSGGRGADYSMFAVGAININSSPDVEIYNNNIGANQNAIVAQMRNRGDSATYGYPRDLHNLWVHHNTVTLTTGAQFGEGVQGVNTLSMTDSTPFYDARKNNRFDYNTYQVSSLTDRRFAWNQSYVTFANFQATGQEANGTVVTAPRPGFRVTDPLNDGHWTLASTSSFTTDGTTTLVGDYDATNYGRASFLRFTNVQIPQGATIKTAKVEVKAFGIDTAIPAMTILGHAADNSAAPASRTEMNARATTTAVPWAPTVWTQNAWTDTPSITAIIQQIVNRPGWVPGNAITIFIEPATIAWNTQARISFRTYENAPADAAGLVVTWA